MTRDHNYQAAITITVATFFLQYVSGQCQFNEYDFSRLGSHTWVTKSQDRSTYSLSLCESLADVDAPCNNNAAVCKQSTDNELQMIGNFTQKLADYIEVDDAKKELRLTLKGTPCDKVENDFLKSVVIFKCGRSLGSPVFLDEYVCDSYFEWFTSVACKPEDGDPEPTTEVACSLYDKQGKKRDLSPLIKTSGAYYVGSTDKDTTFYINVCRGITPDTLTNNDCGGSSACIIKDNQAQHAGSPDQALQINEDGDPYLVYTKTDITPGCSGETVTTVTFKCPSRGMGQEPKLLSDEDCNYSVLWETEYACPEDSLVSKTCKLSNEQHGVEIDLTPLINTDPETRYLAEATNSDGSKTYKYYLNVCDDISIDCHGKTEGVTGCQVDGDSSKILGRKDHQTLRYSDRELTLTYTDGDSCHTNFKRTTVIQFHCNQTASNNGKGGPVFNSESNCTYIFDWDTKYACVDSSVTAQCQVRAGKKEFDLSVLQRKSGASNWESLNAKMDNSEERFYINVCGDVIKTGEASQCPDSSAACYKDTDGTYKSIGKFKGSPTYNTETDYLELRYTDGESCDNGQKKKQTVIKLSCKPGDLEGGPVLTSVSKDKCVYEFDWHTAGACVLTKATGSDCEVFDKELGFSFDLSPLIKAGDDSHYKITTSSDHDYYINVCGPVTGLDESCSTNAGSCQVKSSDASDKHNTGTPNGELHYYNGLINLRYRGGDPYQTNPPVPRETEIAFLCDPAAGDGGKGQPEFLAETNHTYAFRWFTKYACPQVPVECVIIDDKTDNQYDLSALTKGEDGGNWESVDSNTQTQFYINVCRPVNPVSIGTGCDATAGICAAHTDTGEADILSSNLGQPTTPKLEADGRILLEYANGESCTTNNGTKSSYKTQIHLHCERGVSGQNTHPLPTGNTDCVYSFTWDTEAACPVTQGEAAEGEDCIVKDPNSDFSYNFQHLRKTGSGEAGYYSTTAPNKSNKYKLNVCGKVADCSGDNTAACLGDVVLGDVSKKLEISDVGVITLTYEGSRNEQGDIVKALIRFDCDKSAFDGELIFDSLDQQTHSFILKTSAACPPEPVECQVTDAKGNEYDLSTLAKDNENWFVPDSRSDASHLRYYINVCKPITATDDTKSCPGGPIGGCQVDTRSEGNSHSMGYVQGQPHATEGGISIRYTGGEVCHKGKPEQSYRSTRVNFFCSPTEESPVMVSESAGCEYLIEWRTPAACPIKTAVGSGCKVTESLYSHTFDLSHLEKMDANYEVDTGEYKFLLNVCGALHDAIGECEGKGSCQTKPSDSSFSPVNAGSANDKLIYEDGIVMLNYTGGRKCHQIYNRSTVIKFTCDHSTVATGPLNYTETDDCSYYFEWPTSLACMPVTIGQCDYVTKDGQVIDLSPLIRTNDNYHVTNAYDTNKKYLLNVCSTVVNQKGVMCPPNSAACEIDTSDPMNLKYTKLGEIKRGESQISEEGQHITITYDHGATCESDNSKTYKTIIQLVCPPEPMEGLDTEPSFITSADCEYRFYWNTNAACHKEDAKPGSDCKVKNPVTGTEFDLSSLKKSEGYTIDDGKGRYFEVNVCDKLQSSECSGSNIGSCQVEKGNQQRNYSAGVANAKLSYISRGVLQLNYTDGKLCHHNNQNRSTVISFTCSRNPANPVVLGETDDCTYYITWPTELACETEVPCSVEKGNKKYDLSPLVEDYHTAQITDALDADVTQSSFYVSVCRPLPPVQGRLCPAQAAVCIEDKDQHTSSLGRVENAPFVDSNTQKITLLYENGDVCDASKSWKSRIEFVCKIGNEKGIPKLISVNRGSCEYLFEWETYLVCDESGPEVTTDCKYTDSRTAVTYDLSGLSKGDTPLVVGKSDEIYSISPCAALNDGSDECKNAAVCRKKGKKHTDFGSISKVTFVSEGEKFKMVREGEDCPSGGKYQSVIIFGCDRNGVGSKPVYFGGTDCSVILTWDTPFACPPDTHECIYSNAGQTFDLTRLSRATGNWEMKDNEGNTYYLNLCESVHAAPAGCPSNAAVCRKGTTGAVEMLGTVDSQAMSFEEGNLIVKYSEGTMACSKRRRRSENASVKIQLTCGKGVAGPHVTNTDMDNCSFEFMWITSLACKEERDEVPIKDGKVVDPISGGSIDISKLLLDRQYTIPTHGYKYLMNLGGPISEPSCGSNAVVCQMSTTSSNNILNIANVNSRTVYIEDGSLELVYTSRETCAPGSTKNSVTTIVDIMCAQEEHVVKKNPAFFYKSKNCHYVFQWETPLVCPFNHGNVIPPGASSSGTPTSPTTVAVVVSVFSVLVIACLLAIVLHKQERREACLFKIRGLFGRRRPGFTYSYQQLNSEEATLDTFLNESNSSPGRYGTDATDNSTFNLLNNDDSDEDDVLLGL